MLLLSIGTIRSSRKTSFTKTLTRLSGSTSPLTTTLLMMMLGSADLTVIIRRQWRIFLSTGALHHSSSYFFLRSKDSQYLIGVPNNLTSWLTSLYHDRWTWQLMSLDNVHFASLAIFEPAIFL